MPDLSGLVEAMARALGELPPVVVALALLGGPSLAFVGYRWIASSQGIPTSDHATAAPYWVCQDCRSINALRATHCYHCGQAPATADDLEVLVEGPSAEPATFAAPAASPFAALGAAPTAIPVVGMGVPVMADAASGDADDEEVAASTPEGSA